MRRLTNLASLFLLASFALAANQAAYSQSAIIRGEASAGVYETIKTDGSQSLSVAIVSSPVPVTSAVFTTSAPTVTSTSGSLLSSNTSRKSVLVQNNHASATIYLSFIAATAATTSMLALGPGQSLYLAGIIPTAQINAIGSVASNTSVVVVEGQ